MERTHTRAAAILAQAGIEVVWRSCLATKGDAACNAAPALNEAIVRLLSGPSPVAATACGIALVPAAAMGHFVSLFKDCIRASASELGVAEDVVFGCTLAHEIGHLLLGTNSHGSLGLMQAQPRSIDWERAVHGALRFTDAERRRIQEALKRRGERHR
jgi:hypothetical protein